jgi:predicted transcriptional regulator
MTRHTYILVEACKHVGIGLATVQSAARDAETAASRAKVASMLYREAKLSTAEIAVLIHKTEGAVRAMLKKEELLRNNS